MMGIKVLTNKDIQVLYEFFIRNDKAMIPPLSERVDLYSYAYKVLHEAIVLGLYRKEGSCGGISIFYADPHHFSHAFWSYLVVEEDIREHDGGMILSKNTHKYIKDLGMKGIVTRTWESNRSAIIMHLYNGFKIKSKENNRGNNELSVNLILDF